MSYKVLFICLHRPERSPSQRFRFEQYLSILRENGYDCVHKYLLNAKDDKVYYRKGNFLGKTRILFKSIFLLIRQAFFKKYDIVFIQREAFMLGTAFFEKRFAKRAKTIFDFDDSIWMQQTGTVKSKNSSLYFLKDPNKTKTIIQRSAMIFAGNPFLADYAKEFNKNVKIIPTTIDTSVYTPVSKTPRDKVCIGWSGSFSTIIHFQFLENVLKKLKDKYQDKIYIKVIGDATYENKKLDVKGIAWNKQTELEDLSEIDIGVMPLPDDRWTKGKCALKGLQYMGLSIPSIMSPVGVNVDVIQDGENGFLASTEDEWVEKISLLVDSYELRQKVGKAGRITVEKEYSVDAISPLYLQYFKELLNNK